MREKDIYRSTAVVYNYCIWPIYRPSLSMYTQTSAVFQERCTARGIVDCAYAAYAYDAMWTVANAVNSLNFDLLYMAISESNFSGASVKN